MHSQPCSPQHTYIILTSKVHYNTHKVILVFLTSPQVCTTNHELLLGGCNVREKHLSQLLVNFCHSLCSQQNTKAWKFLIVIFCKTITKSVETKNLVNERKKV